MPRLGSFYYTDNEWEVLKYGFSLAERNKAIELIGAGKPVDEAISWHRRYSHRLGTLEELARAEIDRRCMEEVQQCLMKHYQTR